MTKTNLKPRQIFDLPSVYQADSLARFGTLPESDSRFIVIVPSLGADFSAVARRVWELATASNARILFLGVCNDPAHESSLRRELITMSALVKEGGVISESEILVGKDWLSAVKRHLRTNDTVVCLGEQHMLPSQKLLSQILQTEVTAPLYILSGLYSNDDVQSNPRSQIFGWLGSFLLIFGFFLLQAQIGALPENGLRTFFLIASILIEFGMIWGWNNLIS